MHKIRTRSALTAALALACGACATGGGSFDLLDAPSTTVVNNDHANQQPKFVDAPSPDAGAAGATITIPWGSVDRAVTPQQEPIAYTGKGIKTGKENESDNDFNNVLFTPDIVKDEPLTQKNVSLLTRKNDNWIGSAKQKSDEIEDKEIHKDGNEGTDKYKSRLHYYYSEYKDYKYDSLKFVEFDHTKAGVLVLWGSNQSLGLPDPAEQSNLFWRGWGETKDLPTMGTAKYYGYWEYGTRQRKNPNTGTPDTARQKESIYNTVNLTVDFSSKTVEGKFRGKDEDSDLAKIGYDLPKTKIETDETSKKSTFKGTATKNTDSTTLFKDSEASKPLDDEAYVTGTFFGIGATEIAGNLQGKQGGIAGVYAAKKEGSDEKAVSANVLKYKSTDISGINLSEKGKAALKQKNGAENSTEGGEDSQSNGESPETANSQTRYEKAEETKFSGDLTKLIVDGVLIDLSPKAIETADATDSRPEAAEGEAAAKPEAAAGEDTAVTSESEAATVGSATESKLSAFTKLAAVSFGQYSHEQKGGYFAQGVLTPKDQVPTTGTAKYRGSWYGFFSAPLVHSKDTEANKQKAGSNVSISKQDAEFEVDFAGKKINGSLYQTAVGGNKAVEFSDATISDNGFSGTAKVNFTRTSEDQSALKGDAMVKGSFFGPNANELGGYIQSESSDNTNPTKPTFTAVFGAKQLEAESK